MAKSWCSVPRCTNSKKKSPHLSFHDFPANESLRADWVRAIRRHEGPSFEITRGSTYVCSEHFNPEDLRKPTQTSGRTRLKHGAVPSRFFWNYWGSRARVSVCQRARKRLCSAGLDDSTGVSVPGDSKQHRVLVWTVHGTEERSEESGQGALQAKKCIAAAKDHDYDCRVPHGDLNSASFRIRELELKVMDLEMKLEQMKVGVQQPLIDQYCVTDDDFCYYTRFISKEVFTEFWESIKPSASNFVYWTKAQQTAQDPSTCTSCHELPLIDEFFMFLCRVAAGLHERLLSSIFKVSQSTVSRVILTWTSYLFLVLGSRPLWMTQEQIESTMPDKFKLSCPEVRVLLDSTEIHCETPSSPSLQSEIYSSYKNHTTFKGLIGISPCGMVTFVSELYPDSISDVEITQESQLLQLLQPGDGVMADNGFLTERMLSKVGATLIIPPLKKSGQLSTEDTLKTDVFTDLRILVARAIRRVKEYQILDGLVPLSMTGSVNQLWTICCIMSNYMGSLDIKEDKPV